jgi:hypothetical protein
LQQFKSFGTKATIKFCFRRGLRADGILVMLATIKKLKK